MHNVKLSINNIKIPMENIWAQANLSYGMGVELSFLSPMGLADIGNSIKMDDYYAEIQMGNTIFVCPPGTITKLQVSVGGEYRYREDDNPDAEPNKFPGYLYWEFGVRNQTDRYDRANPGTPLPDIEIKVLKAPEQKCLI